MGNQGMFAEEKRLNLNFDRLAVMGFIETWDIILFSFL